MRNLEDMKKSDNIMSSDAKEGTENIPDIDKVISELVNYASENELIEADDKIFIVNRLLDIFEKNGLAEDSEIIKNSGVQELNNTRPIADILSDCLKIAVDNGLIEDTQLNRDLFDTKVMGAVTPIPSVVRKHFKELYNNNPKLATDYFYELNKACNYIRCDRIEKDQKWKYNSEYGIIDITINLSKPEKDPKDIIKQGKFAASGYPKCLLCKENEGYAGNLSHPARQNLRVIPLELSGEKYYMQYSPYVYYNEHCIVFNDKHIPMKINKSTFKKLIEFTDMFPHYTLGSNADLPIVGGSILSHDHFQGGAYEFPMARAEYVYTFKLDRFSDVNAAILNWPMSVIRLSSNNKDSLVNACDYILDKWKNYTDEKAFIYCNTDGEQHNTITPICRQKGDNYEMDLVLRNNITTNECPWGVYHPSANLHHIKKENIGLIEVMGMAILPARLDKEMGILKNALLNNEDVCLISEIEKHAQWVDSWKDNYNITKDNIDEIIRLEIGKVFVQVLECAGVYKTDDNGREAFVRFIKYCQ